MSRTAIVLALLLLAVLPAPALAGPEPTVGMTAPAKGATYRDGEPVALRGSGSADTALTWRVVPGDGTESASATGPEASFTPRDDLGADASYAITLTATDEHGHTTSITREIHPELASLSLRSDPPGAGIAWGASPLVPAPFDLGPAVGQKAAVEAAPDLQSGGCRFVFDHWSDGGERRHVFTAPAGSATLTALYAPDPGSSCAAVAPGDGVGGAGGPPGSARRRGPEVELSQPRAPTRVLRGTAEDPDGVLFVKVALRRAGGGLGCRWWSPRVRRFQRVRTSCARPHWMTARVSGGTWRLDLRARLRPGRYVLVFRSADRRGAVAQGLADGIQQVPLQLVQLEGRK